MTIEEKIQAQLILEKLAQNHGRPVERVRQEMQIAIDAAWSTGDLATLAIQLQRFPDGKPTVEEFLLRASKEIRNHTNKCFA